MLGGLSPERLPGLPEGVEGRAPGVGEVTRGIPESRF